MSTLEEALREAAAKGITHLTLYPVETEDRKTTYWHAKATPSSAHSYVQVTTTDPVDALTAVLKALPKAPRRAAPTKQFEGYDPPLVDHEVTAAVNSPAYTTSDEQWAKDSGVIKDKPQQEDIETWLPKA